MAKLSVTKSRKAPAKAEAPACSICTEPFNKSTRKPFESACCPEFEVCRGCVGRYVMDSTQAPSCMACKGAYGQETLERGFTKKFTNEIYDEQARLFKDTQRAQLPDTMRLVERFGEIDGLEQEQREISDQIRELHNRHDVIRRRIADIKNYREPSGEATAARKEERVFVMPCAHAECRGFVSKR